MKFIKSEVSKHGNSWDLHLSSGDGDEYPGCKLIVRWPGRYTSIRLPAIIKPHGRKVVPDWDAATVARLGRDWYMDWTERCYGVRLFEGHFNVMYGLASDDSRTEQRWSCFLPWTQWRFVRHSLYDLAGNWLCDMPQFRRGGDRLSYHWLNDALKAAQPLAHFAFRDYDGEEIKVRLRVEEREWRFGEKWFRWLSLFRKPQIRRSVDLWFSSEVGKRKGSWKGGTLGHAVEMTPGESIEAAFRRYCGKQGLTFIGPCDPWKDKVRAPEPSADAKATNGA